MADAQYIYLKTLGCDKNTVDSQMMQGILFSNDFCIIDEPAEADIIIINTCCFIETAKNESIDAIFELIPYKTQGSCQKIIVTGCMVQRYGSELAELIPEIDHFIGVNDIHRIIDVIHSSEEHILLAHREDPTYKELLCSRYFKNDTVTAYLKISEGCNKHCTYCAIPEIRGHYRSRTPKAIMNEAHELFENGIKELIIIGEDITEYGKDLDDDIDLSILLADLAECFSFEWIRLMYLYPEGINEQLIDVMAAHKNICHYIDMPIQHTEDNILKRMGRNIDKKTICDKVYMIRSKMPDVVLRTTIITGFPNESEKEFEALLTSLQHFRFERLGAFAFSCEEGTPAAKLDFQIDEKTKEERRRKVYDQQEIITSEKNSALIGQKMKVLVEEVGEGISYGRTYGDAPEIDCGVIIEDDALTPGNFYDVKITYSAGFDLLGEIGE